MLRARDEEGVDPQISGTPALRRRHFLTRDFDQARDILAPAYGDHAPRLRGDPERFVLRASTVETDLFGLDDDFYGSIVENDYRPLQNTLTIGLLREGRVAFGDGDQQRTVVAGDLLWFRPDRPHHIWSEDIAPGFARLDMAALDRVASEMSGQPPGTLRFLPGPPVSEQRTRYWDMTRRWIAECMLPDEALMAEPLMRADAFRALARATLLAAPNTALDALTHPTTPALGGAEPAVVRRAVEFIDGNAQSDIDLAQIADAARIGVRGLQAAFRRHRDLTPLDYLRRVRMQGAHRDLQAADSAAGDTVSAIAARWGLTHAGRFSVEYRRLYDCSPRETLRS